MQPQLRLIEDIRRRLEELRERLRFRGVTMRGAERKPLLQEQVVPGVIGGGKLIEAARKQVDLVTARFKERKPMVVPAVTEAIEKWVPGKRIKGVLPVEKKGAPAPAAEEKRAYRLRR